MAVAQGARTVLAWGGDGTINEIGSVRRRHVLGAGDRPGRIGQRLRRRARRAVAPARRHRRGDPRPRSPGRRRRARRPAVLQHRGDRLRRRRRRSSSTRAARIGNRGMGPYVRIGIRQTFRYRAGTLSRDAGRRRDSSRTRWSSRSPTAASMATGSASRRRPWWTTGSSKPWWWRIAGPSPGCGPAGIWRSGPPTRPRAWWCDRSSPRGSKPTATSCITWTAKWGGPSGAVTVRVRPRRVESAGFARRWRARRCAMARGARREVRMAELETLIRTVKEGDARAREGDARRGTVSRQCAPADGESPVMAALYRGHHDVVDALLDAGAEWTCSRPPRPAGPTTCAAR